VDCLCSKRIETAEACATTLDNFATLALLKKSLPGGSIFFVTIESIFKQIAGSNCQYSLHAVWQNDGRKYDPAKERPNKSVRNPAPENVISKATRNCDWNYTTAYP